MTIDRAIIGFVDLNGVRFELHQGLAVTTKHLSKRSTAAIYRAARDLGVTERNYADAYRAVEEHVIQKWYEEQDLIPPDDPLYRDRNRNRIRRARAERQEKGEDEPNAADVIREGLREGKTKQEILATVHRLCPSSKADDSHVHYYRHQLRKNGEELPEPGESNESNPEKAMAEAS